MIWNLTRALYGVLPPSITAPLRSRLLPNWELRRMRKAVSAIGKAVNEDAAFYPGEKILVDCGFNNGFMLEQLLSVLPPDFKAYGFEVNKPRFYEAAQRLKARNPNILDLHFSAVSSRDGVLDFYEMGDIDRICPAHATTIIPEIAARKKGVQAQSIPSRDFSAWLKETWKRHTNGVAPYVVVKMDIEGAEYDVLKSMLENDAMKLVNYLIIEFHSRCFKGIQRTHVIEHERALRATLNEGPIRVCEWI